MKDIVSRIRKSTLLFAFLSFTANIMLGQDIALVEADPAVKNGVLPNGMRWYVAVNPKVKGTADFALVQHIGSSTVPDMKPDSIAVVAQKILASRPLMSSSVQDFFVRKGCVPGPKGFVEVRENATIFKFRKINLKQSESVLDSTLLVLMNMAGEADGAYDADIRKWYAPSDQAIIVCGDVDAGVVSEKIKMLSYMLPSSESLPRPEYEWCDREGVNVVLRKGYRPGAAHVSLSWRLPRMPKDLMNTVMPAIYERYMTMSGYVAEERLNSRFRQLSVPVTSVSSAYVGSSGHLGDEVFSVSVVVAPDDVEKAVSVLSEVMGGIDSYGSDVREVRNAGRRYTDALYAAGNVTDIGNREYLDRCICSFIYNSPLSSRSDINRFHSSHVLPDSTECRLFGSIASASIDVNRNITLEIMSDDRTWDEEVLKTLMKTSWHASLPLGNVDVPVVSYQHKTEEKVKVKSMKKEYLSGGEIWTLSNGIRVMVKKMPKGDRMIHYSLSLNSGSGNVPGLNVGEGGYLSDYFALCNVGGVSWKDFRNEARRRGMTVDCRVGHSVTEFKGRIPKEMLAFLFEALQTMMNDRKTDTQAWEYYVKGESLRRAASVSAGYNTMISDGFAQKADGFFRDMAENINNGIIVLVGDIDQKELKDVLTAYGAGFRTSERAFTRVEASGTLSDRPEYVAKRQGEGLEIVISAPLALTSGNYYTTALAVMALKKQLAIETAGKGLTVKVGQEFRLYPQETLILRVFVDEVLDDGLAVGVSSRHRDEALAAIRALLFDPSSVEVDDGSLDSYKYRVEKYLLLEKELPEYWINALNLRYLAGKDFTTGAEARIKAVKKEDIKRLLTVIGNGSRTEYELN